jgi:hypothetical protein
VRIVFAIGCLTGCHALFGLEGVEARLGDGGIGSDAVIDAARDAALACSLETFEVDLSSWTAYGGPTCGATVVNGHGRLQIDANSACYTEMRWPMSRVVTGSTISVEVVNAGIQAQNVQMYVELRLDSTNYVYFEVANLNMNLGKRVMGANQATKTLSYDSGLMRYWRFVQVPATNIFELYTGTGMADGWTRRHSVEVAFAHEPLTLLLGAGAFSGGVGTESVVELDNVSVCDP